MPKTKLKLISLKLMDVLFFFLCMRIFYYHWEARMEIIHTDD